MTACAECGRQHEASGRDGLCFRCKVATVGFTFRGAHPGRQGWNEDTVMGYQREVYEGAREHNVEIERVR